MQLKINNNLISNLNMKKFTFILTLILTNSLAFSQGAEDSKKKNTNINDGGIGVIDFPLVSDMNHSIMSSYGIEHPEGTALRASFLIDENFVVRHQVE